MIGEFQRAAGNSDSVLLNHDSGPALVASTGTGHVTALV